MAHRFELHYHTSESSSCARISARDSIPLYKAYGYDGIVVTDHLNPRRFEIRYGPVVAADPSLMDECWQRYIDVVRYGRQVAEEAGKRIGVTVLQGGEVNLKNYPNDFLVYGQVEPFFRSHPGLVYYSPEQFCQAAHEAGLFISHAHPFRHDCQPLENVYLDAMEVFNGSYGHLAVAHNDLAMQYALDHDLIPTVGSDFHKVPDLPRACVQFIDDIRTPEELVSALRARRFELLICPFKKA